MKLLRPWLLALSLLLLLASHFVLQSALWLGVTDEAFAFLQPLGCVIPLFCQLLFQRYFGLALIGISVALVLFGLTQRHTHPSLLVRALSVSPLSLNYTSRIWSRWFRACLLVAVPTVSLLALHSLTLSNPPPLLWLWCLALVAAMFYGADRAAQRSGLLTRTELLLLIGYLIFLLALGYAYRDGLTRLIAIVAALIVVLWLWRRQPAAREAIAFVMIVLLAFAVYTLDLMSWRYAYIGDEYAFYESANNIINAVNRPYLLSPMGTYDVHPVFATYIQATTMLLYGNDIYGWRISETLAVMLAALPLYVLLRTLVNARSALLALVVFLASQHLLGFTKVGYTYSQLLVPLTSAWALFALAARRGSLLGLFLSGLASAFAFYTFAFGIPFISLLLLMFGLFMVVSAKQANASLLQTTVAAAALVIGIGLTAIPSLSDAQAIQRIAGHTVANSEVRAVNNLTEQVIPNFLYVLDASLSFLGHSHYVSGAHLDPLSSILMLLGLTASIMVAHKNRMALWLLLSFLLACFFVGGLAPYPYPPIARTYILVPFYALFAAVGASRLLAAFKSRRLHGLVWLGLLLAIPALNLYQFFVLTDRQNPHEHLALLVKEFQEQPSVSTFYLVERLPFNYNVTRMVLKAYNLNPDKLVIISQEDPAASLPAIARSGKSPYAILVNWQAPLRDRWRTGFRQWWAEQTESEVADATGLIHYAKLMVSGQATDVLVRATATPIAETPFIVTPGLLPRPLGVWKAERPRDVAISAEGLTYIINGAQQSIEVRDLNGKLLRTLAGDWREPFALAFNSRHELLALDVGQRAITLLRADGTVSARSGNELGLSSPRGFAVGPNDDVYVADTGGARLIKLNSALLEPEVVRTSVVLKQPASLSFVGDKLVVADEPWLYVLSATGELIAQWRITPYNTNQPPRILSQQPQLIVITDPEAGEIILFDLQGHILQKIGPPNYERMRKPIGIAATREGKIFVAENEGDLVRAFEWGGP